MEVSGETEFRRYMMTSEINPEDDLLCRIGCDTIDKMIANATVSDVTQRDNDYDILYDELLSLAKQWSTM